MTAHQNSDQTDIRNLIETIPALVLCVLPDGSVEFVNRAWLEYTGEAPQESGWSWQTSMHPDDVAQFVDEWNTALTFGKPFETEVRLRRTDGQFRWFLIRKTLAVVQTAGGEPSLRTLIACENIHDRKQAEDAAGRSEQELRDLIENIPAMVFIALPGPSNAFVSRGWREYTGLSAEDTAGSGWQCVLHPDDLQRHIEKWRVCSATGELLEDEARIRRAGEGVYRWFLVRAVPLRDKNKNILKWYGVLTDIEQRKRAEETLREQASLLSLTHDAIFVCDLDGILKYWNRGAEELYGWTTEEVFGKLPHDLLRTIFPIPLQEIDAEVIRTGRWEGELVQTKKDGTQIVAASRWSLQRDEKGSPVGFLETNNDITKSKRAEDALKRSEGYLTQAERLAHIGSWAFDTLTRKLLYLSDEWYCLFGFDPKHGMPTWEQRVQRIHPEDRAGNQAAIDRAIDEKSGLDAEFRVLLPNSTVRHIRSVGHPVLGPSGEITQFVGVAMDVTTSRQAEEERERLRRAHADLAHISRVSTLGELTASLAHELKQPIGAAVTNAEAALRLLDRGLPDVAEAREAAFEAVKDARRAADIIDRVRSLYTKGSSRLEMLDVNEVIEEMVSMLDSEANRHSVTIRTELTPGFHQLSADRVQLQQVLMNLMLNGIEAMRDTGGQLMIKSELVEDGHMLISVRDTGVGLPAENTDRIFNAFFTTKSQGTGLGLAITRSIVESHGGRVWATANSGPGATFQFTLPTKVALPV